jgi:hypothetical protein
MALSYLWKAPRDTFDRNFGVETAGFLSPEEGGIPSSDAALARAYVPSHESVIRHMLRNLPVEHREYEFVDLGCGRGRVLLLAMMYPWKRIQGVELSAITSTQARTNVEAFVSKNARRVRCRSVQITRADAVNVEFAPGKLVMYLYRPFLAPVLIQVLHNIAQMARATNSDVLIAYSCPVESAVFEQSGAFARIHSYTCISLEYSWELWRFTG